MNDTISIDYEKIIGNLYTQVKGLELYIKQLNEQVNELKAKIEDIEKDTERESK